MIPRRNSLLRTLLASIALPGALMIMLGCLVVYNLFKEEYDELLDIGLTAKAHLLLDVFEARSGPDSPPIDMATLSLLAFEKDSLNPEERTVFWLLDATGTVLGTSPLAQSLETFETAKPGLSTQGGYRVAVVPSATGIGLTIVVAEPMDERNEAILDVMSAVIVGFLLLGMLFYMAAYFAVRRSTGILAALSDNIAQKDAHDLSPIDRRNSFAEIEPAIDTLDTLMARLDSALGAERAFATNAAHELRTPVAISLAHAQRLKSMLSDPALSASATEIEAGLKRLVRLIERLLQMSRAQSGLGLNATVTDINPVIHLLLKDLRRRAVSDDRLVITEPSGAWYSRVDPDALGIILNNLFDNAFKHASGEGPVVVDASQPGRLTVTNDCAPLTPAEVEEIKRRFVRKAPLSEGYGLGLSIVQELCDQSGCTFDIVSPLKRKDRGFSVTLTFPTHTKPD